MSFLDAAVLSEIKKRSLGESRYLDIDCTSWGCTVRLKRLSAGDVMAITKLTGRDGGDETVVIDDSNEVRFMAMVLSKSIVDESGNLLLDSEDGISFLSQEPVNVLVPLSKAAYSHSGLDVLTTKELEKN